MTTRNRTDLVIHRDAPPKALEHRSARNQCKAAVRPRLPLNNIKPIFELGHLMACANNLRPNYNQHATGFLGAIAAALRSEFPEPIMSPADINSVSQALNELKELLDSAELPADLRVILQGYISRMVRALADPKAIDMQEVFESTAAATVVARQMENRTSEPDQKERASKIAGLWNSVGRFVGRAITFGVTHPEQIERLGHDAQGLFAQISSAI